MCAVIVATCAGWSAPTRVENTTALYDLGFTPDGRGFLTSLCCRSFTPGVPGTRFAFSHAGGTFGGTRKMSDVIAARLVGGTKRHMRAVGWIAGPGSFTDTGVANVVKGRLGKPFRVLPVMTAGTAEARNARGDLAIVGHVSTKARVRATRGAIYMTFGRAGRKFTRPQKLDRGGGPAALGVAVNNRGRILAVWQRAGAIFARERLENGRLGPRRQIATDTGADPRPALGPAGEAVVAWTSHAAQADPSGAATLRIVTRARDSSFGSAIDVERSGDEVALAPLGNGSIQLVWRGFDGTRSVVRALDTAGRAVGPTQTISGPPPGEARNFDLAIGRRDEVAIVWSSQRSEDPQDVYLEAAFRKPGETIFSAPESVAGPTTAGIIKVAFNWSTDQIFAAWTSKRGVFTTSRPRVE